jgi:uncharacterized membrane protein
MTATKLRMLWLGVIALAIVGVAISTYLTITHWTDRPVICAGLGSCATVQSSEYARVAGVPVALLGLGMYVAVAVGGMMAVTRPTAALAVFGISLAGALYSGYLTWLELAVIDAICLWCVASALIVSAIAVLGGVAALLPQPASGPSRAARVA